MDEPIIIRYEIVALPHIVVLQVELNNGDFVDIGEAINDELDEVDALEYIGRTCKGRTVAEVKQMLHESRVALIRASAVIR